MICSERETVDDFTETRSCWTLNLSTVFMYDEISLRNFEQKSDTFRLKELVSWTNSLESIIKALKME